MQKIEKYSGRNELASAIDNGGRFYNLFTQADDNIVTKAELAKAAGTWASDHNVFLFLELAMADLTEMDRQAIVKMLEPGLRNRYLEKRPPCLNPSAVDAEGMSGECLIVEGRLERCVDKSKFSGFIYIPIVVGDVTTFTMIPIFDNFDVYQVFDSSREGINAVVAVPPKSPFSDGDRVRFGGYLRDLEFDNEEDRTNQFYLEAMFFSPQG